MESGFSALQGCESSGVRIRVPRRQLRDDEHAQWSPCSGESCRGGKATEISVIPVLPYRAARCARKKGNRGAWPRSFLSVESIAEARHCHDEPGIFWIF